MDLSLCSRSLTCRSFRSRKARCLWTCQRTELLIITLHWGLHTLPCSVLFVGSAQVWGYPCRRRYCPFQGPDQSLHPQPNPGITSGHKAVVEGFEVNPFGEEREGMIALRG